MDEAKLREIIDKVNETEKGSDHIVEYTMDYGPVAVLVRMSKN